MTASVTRNFQRRFLYMTLEGAAALGLYDRFLSLIPADGGPRDVDPDLVGDLHLDAGVGYTGDLAVDAARHDDFVADLQGRLELCHLLLTLAHRHEHEEIKDT